MLAPIVRGRKGEFKQELAAIRPRGFTRARVDGHLHSLEEEIALDRRKNHTIEVLVDRLIVKSGIERRLSDSIAIALDLADDIVIINTLEAAIACSRGLACPNCGISIPEMTPRAFSFNSPHGACPGCQGLGATSISIRRASCPTNRDRSGGRDRAWVPRRSRADQRCARSLERNVRHQPRNTHSASSRRNIAICCSSAQARAARRRRRRRGSQRRGR